MRLFLAALLAAVVLFVWQAVSHMLLPIGDMGFRAPQKEDAVLAAVGSDMAQPGIYRLPYLDSARMGDEAAMASRAEKAKAHPYAFVVVAAPIQSLDMTRQLALQFLVNFIAASIVAVILAATGWGFGARMLGAFGLGLFGWLANVLPLANWYLFPREYVLGALLEQGIGWLLAGVAMAMTMAPARRRRRF